MPRREKSGPLLRFIVRTATGATLRRKGEPVIIQAYTPKSAKLQGRQKFGATVLVEPVS